MDLCHSEMEDKLKSFPSCSKKRTGQKMKYKKYWNAELDNRGVKYVKRKKYG